MDDVEIIYHNQTGIAFKWKKHVPNTDSRRVQMVIKNMGFYLFPGEIKLFSENIKTTKTYFCGYCPKGKHCRNILLRSPLDKMDFTVTRAELMEIADLIEGTLFKLNLEEYVNGCGRN